MRITGACHCRNITYVYEWPGDAARIPVRACGCTFCTMRGATYTSHRGAALTASISEAALLSKYRFGTRTADFYVCARCGAVPFVTSQIKGRLYAVVNVNTFEGIGESVFDRAVTDFDGEDADGRLERRSRTWIPSVTISESVP